MNWLTEIDWSKVLEFGVSPVEIIFRGTVMYLALVVMLRVISQRQIGAVSIPDVLVIVLIADAAQNGMAGQYESVPDGILLVATILFWSFALDWLGYKFPLVGRFMYPPSRMLIKDGQLNKDCMRAELLTREELMSQLREQGIEHIKDVKVARMEGDGKISVVPMQQK